MDVTMFSRRIIAVLYVSLLFVFTPSAALALGSGTQSDPVILNIGTSYPGSIGPGSSVYYKFTTGNQAFKHTISMDSLSSRYNWFLYSDVTYTTLVDTCSGYQTPFSCTTPNLNPQSTYYMQLTEVGGQSDTYNIKLDVIIGSEGSYDNRVNLTVGTPYIAAVKAKSSINGQSYYAFTTVNAGYHTISLSGATTDMKWELNTSLGGLYTELVDCDEIWSVGDESCSTTYLEANTTYHMIVENAGEVGSFVTINISEGGAARPVGADEGTMLNPVTLTANQSHIATVAGNGTSYYKFTTGNTVNFYVINTQRISTSHDIDFYLDPGFTLREAGCNEGENGYLDRKCNLTFLDPNTTYYFSLKNLDEMGDIFLLNVLQSTPRSPYSEGTTLSPINLSVGTVHAGKVDAWDQSYYTFTATEAKPYRISLSSNTHWIYWVTKLDWDFLRAETVCDAMSIPGSCVTGRFDAGQTVYLYVGNEDQFNADTFNLLVEVENSLSEGTVNTPIPVIPGTPHNGSVEASSTSYYQFTTGNEPLVYTVALTGLSSDLEWRMVNTTDRLDYLSCFYNYDNSDEICTSRPLKPNTTYRIEVKERSNLASNYTLSVSKGQAPTPLDLERFQSETVEAYSTFQYYKFTTSSMLPDAYTISVSGASHEVSWMLFDDPQFPSSGHTYHCGGAYFSPHNISCTVTGLLPDTTYYVRTSTNKLRGVIANYDIVVNQGGGDEGSIAEPVALVLPASHAGSVANSGASYYQFTTADGGPKTHLISLNGLSSDLGWYLYRDAAYTDLLMSCNDSRNASDESCFTSESLKAGTTFYLKVFEYNNYSGRFKLDITVQKNGGKK